MVNLAKAGMRRFFPAGFNRKKISDYFSKLPILIFIWLHIGF
jgi:hypothetical protein